MKLENEELIPLESKDSWLKYNNQIFVIRADIHGTGADFQFDGTLCKQCFIKGFVHAKFKSNAMYFNPNHWYNSTIWGKDYPNKMYFIDDDGERLLKYNPETYPNIIEEKWLEKIIKITKERSISTEKILASIIASTIRKTGLNISFPFDNMSYDEFWWEAKVPIKFGDKLEYDGIITWENCD